MLTPDNNRLIVIQDMQVDWSLPKYVKQRSSEHEDDESDGDDMVMHPDTVRQRRAVRTVQSNIRFNNVVSGNLVWAGTSTVAVNAHLVEQKPSPGKSWWKKLWEKKAPPPPTEPTLMSVEEFFKSVKHSAQELSVIKERAAGYERALLNAKKAGQQALVEKLEAGINAHRMEAQLVAIGLTKFVVEEDIVRFYKQSKKGLRLDYVKNFTRQIPEDVTAKKARADELGLFDNYVILHYDPASRAFEETKREKEARKDPIMFGLMRDREALYFVGDWVDETCDLTLDQIAEELGKDAVQSLMTTPYPYR